MPESCPTLATAKEGWWGGPTETTNVIPFLMRKIPVKTDTTRTITINYGHIEAAIVAYLQALGEIKDNEEVTLLDLGLAVGDDDLVAIDLEAYILE
jgi:hypothetical protein